MVLGDFRTTFSKGTSNIMITTTHRREMALEESPLIPPRKMDVAIAGLGAIGMALVRNLSRGAIPGMKLTGVAARDKTKARGTLDGMSVNASIYDLEQLPAIADIVVECAPAAVLDKIVRPVLLAGKTAIVLSAGALLSHPELIELASSTSGRIIVPTGALLGLDAVSAAAEGQIYSVKMVTRKPITGLLGAPYLVENGIDIRYCSEPTLVFSGTARKAAKGFPANLNVAAALSLAGIGPDKTMLEIWADPTIVRNTHRIVVDSDSARLDMTIENIPSENPKTGRITALSVMSTLRKLNAPLRVGS
jgi:aspartate dehydrogenase